jgi:hypothetical protein
LQPSSPAPAEGIAWSIDRHSTPENFIEQSASGGSRRAWAMHA